MPQGYSRGIRGITRPSLYSRGFANALLFYFSMILCHHVVSYAVYLHTMTWNIIWDIHSYCSCCSSINRQRHEICFKLMELVSYNINFKAHIPQKNGFALGARRKWNLPKKHEMYMPDAKILRWHLTQSIFHWLASGFGVGANANFRVGVGGLASGNANIHISDTNMLVSPTKKILASRAVPNAGSQRQVFCVLVECRL